MSDILLDSVWDIDLSENDLQLTSGREGIQQHWAQRLKTFYGEWFLNKKIGIPYFQHILKKNANPVIIDSVFKKETIQTPGIIRITQFNLDLDNSTRELSLTARASSEDGIVSFEGAIP